MKNKYILTAIYISIILIGSIIAFLFVPLKSEVFWVSYLFTMIAFFASYFAMAHSISLHETKVSYVFSILPILLIYLLVEITAVILGCFILKMDLLPYFSLHLIIVVVFMAISVILLVGSTD